MFRALKHSGRRGFLRGVAGSALALPLLEYTHGDAWARGDNATCRFMTVFSHGGTISNQEGAGRHAGNDSHHGEDYWRPADPTSEALVLGPIHSVLEAHRDQLLVLEGVDNKAVIGQEGRGKHRFSNVSALTAADMSGADEDSASSLGPSIDQVIAERLAERQPVPIQRMHLTVDAHNYGSPYFSAPQQRASGIKDPAEAFDAFFSGISGDEGPSPAVIRQNKMRGSALDGLLQSYDEMRDEVSASDRHAVEAHLEYLRALEAELENPVVCSPPQGIDASGSPGNVAGPQHVRLIIAAMRCGLTNVANLEIGDLLTPWTDAGTPLNVDRGHTLHHRGRDIGPNGTHSHQYDDWFAEILDNRRWRMGLLDQLLTGLSDPDFSEGGRTILDNSVVLYTSEFRNGSRHVSHNMPILLAGSGGGYFDTGRFIDYNEHASEGPNTLNYATSESTHNLFTSILHAMGESDTHFGSDHADHQGPLPGLTA